MGALYDKIASLDRGIADRWKARTRENPEYMRAADIDAIVGPMMRTERKMTEKQANAIVTFVKGTKFDTAEVAPIRKRLRYYVKLADAALGLERVPLVGDELLPIYAALTSAGVLKINFKSPKTGLTYVPNDYLAVGRLIESNEIICAEVRIGEMANLAESEGVYTSDFNILTLYNGQTPPERTVTVVHEATHVIQDFRNAKGIATHFEADAFVAEGVVARTLNRNAETHGPIGEAALKAAEFVMKGDAQQTKQAWLDAYDAVLNAVNSTPGYKAKSRLMVDKGRNEEKQELDTLKAIIAAIEKSQAFQSWAVDALDTTFVTPIRRIKEVLP